MSKFELQDHRKMLTFISTCSMGGEGGLSYQRNLIARCIDATAYYTWVHLGVFFLNAPPSLWPHYYIFKLKKHKPYIEKIPIKILITRVLYAPQATVKLNTITSESQKERKCRLKTYKCVGEFADLQYQQTDKYIKSDDFKRQQENIKQAKQQSNALDATSEDVRRTKIQLSNQSKIDQGLVTETEEKRERYLLLAIQ